MRNRLPEIAPRFLAVLILSAAALALSACSQVVPYRRTLPDWVRRVYVPMAVNKTTEPGLEELVTNAFAIEIEADGRLEVVQKSKADLIAQATLYDYRERSAGFESDDVESIRQMELVVGLDLFDPKDMKNPYARVGSAPIRTNYNSDYRSSTVELDVDARERLGQTVGAVLLQSMMTRAEFLAK
ncbi:hypothetical protein JW916_09525 [Candidatus Sumerlaeota bacterium]|nr:hypothetical protein [Candidatus Sumerlaeota bacterium]